MHNFSEDIIKFEDTCETQKKWKFVAFNMQPQVYTMHVWQFAYRQARKGIWEEKARDRDRFERRIKKFGEIFEPILVKILNKK